MSKLYHSHEIKNDYDLIVIGGGVQGAGVALIAGKAGYKVLLVEKNTWASGTSCRSSKLVHGGLRYLQTGQFKLVNECLQERNWMLRSIPEIVRSNWFFIPVYKYSRYKAWQIHLALWFYRLFSGKGEWSSYKKLSVMDFFSQQGNKCSQLVSEDLKCVFAYQDAQTDDAKLTQAIVDKASDVGVDCIEYTEYTSSKVGRAVKARHNLVLNSYGDEITVNCHMVVNAAGPWVNSVLERLNTPSDSLAIDLVQGSHIVISEKISDQCFYLESPEDQRAVFCLPWKDKTLVGTTELLYNDVPDNSLPTKPEIDYLCDTVKYYFPKVNFVVESSFSGLRVLPTSTKKAFLRPRDTLLHNEDNIISLYGGKLTAWRATGMKVLQLIDLSFDKKSSLDEDNLLV